MADVEVSVGFEAGNLQTMEQQLNALMNKKYKLQIDTSDAAAKIKSIFNNLNGGSGGGSSGPSIKINTTAAERTMSVLGKKIETLQNKTAKMKLAGLDTANLEKSITNLNEQNNLWATNKSNAIEAQKIYQTVREELTACAAEMQRLNSGSSLSNTFTSFESSLDSMSSKLASLGKSDMSGATSSLKTELESISSEYQKLMADIKNPNTATTFVSDGAKSALKSLSDRLDDVKAKASNLSDEFSTINRNINMDGVISQIDALLEKLKSAGPGTDSIKTKLEGLKASLNNGSYDGNLTKLKKALSDISKEVDSLTPSLSSKLSSLVSGAVGSVSNIVKTFALNKVRQVITQAMEQIYQNVLNIDASMTQLKIVTGATDSEMESFFNRSAEAAQKFGASVTEVLDSVQTFSRLGYNLQDSLDLSSYATILSNTAAVSVDEATTGLTSIIKGYNMDASDAEHVADVLIDVGQKYAISAGELMEAFQRGGAALNATGTSFEESTALFAAANAAVQNASTVGTALKTVSARIRGATSELQEMGEETEDVANGLSKYRTELMALTNVNGSGGIDIMENVETGQYKSIYSIFTEISKIWDSLSDTTQSRVSEILGGTRQLSVISSIIGNIADAEGAYTVALNSNGVAQQANETYLDSAEGKIKQLSASWQTFSKDFMSSDIIKVGADSLNSVVKVLDGMVGTIGAIPTVLGAVSLTKLIKNFGITNVFALHGCESMAA